MNVQQNQVFDGESNKQDRHIAVAVAEDQAAIHADADPMDEYDDNIDGEDLAELLVESDDEEDLALQIVPVVQWIASTRRIFEEALENFCQGVGVGFGSHGVRVPYADFAISWHDLMILAYCPDLRKNFFGRLRELDKTIETVYFNLTDTDDWDEHGIPDMPPGHAELEASSTELGVYLNSVTSFHELHIDFGDLFYPSSAVHVALVLRGCRNIRQVTLDFSSVLADTDPETFEVALLAFRRHPMLEEMTIEGISNFGIIDSLFNVLATVKQLTSLSMGNMVEIETLKDAATFCRMIELENLSTLKLGNVTFETEETANMLCNAIAASSIMSLEARSIDMPTIMGASWASAVLQSAVVYFTFDYNGVMADDGFLQTLATGLSVPGVSDMYMLSFSAHEVPAEKVDVVSSFLQFAHDWQVADFHLVLVAELWTFSVESSLCRYIVESEHVRWLSVHVNGDSHGAIVSPRLLEAAGSGAGCLEHVFCTGAFDTNWAQMMRRNVTYNTNRIKQIRSPLLEGIESNAIGKIRQIRLIHAMHEVDHVELFAFLRGNDWSSRDVLLQELDYEHNF